MEHEMDLHERVASLEAAMNGKEGVIDRLKHLDTCVDSLKVTVWKATGALAAVILVVQLMFRH